MNREHHPQLVSQPPEGRRWGGHGKTDLSPLLWLGEVSRSV